VAAARRLAQARDETPRQHRFVTPRWPLEPPRRSGRNPGREHVPGSPRLARRASRPGLHAPQRRSPQPASRCARPGAGRGLFRAAGSRGAGSAGAVVYARGKTSCPPRAAGVPGPGDAALPKALTAGRRVRRDVTRSCRPAAPSAPEGGYCCTSVLYGPLRAGLCLCDPAADLGGRYWDRTSDLLGVKDRPTVPVTVTQGLIWQNSSWS